LDLRERGASGVAGTPSFLINGKRQHGAYDVATLSSAVRAARERAIAKQTSVMPREGRLSNGHGALRG
jgi:hypothetical protein